MTPTVLKPAGILSAEMRKAIARSGYLFEQQLLPLIEKAGYRAEPNHRYRDSDGVMRELDISATSAKEIFPRKREFLWVDLMIECKNLRCPLVFFVHREIRMSYFLGYPHISGLPQLVFRKGRFVDLADFLKVDRFHHYYSRAKIATQFCAVYDRSKPRTGGSGKSGNPEDFIAGHRVGEVDLYGDGILKLVKAVLQEKRQDAERFGKNELANERVDLWLHYPIFVTSGPLYECALTKHAPEYRRVHRVGFLHRGEGVLGGEPDCRIDVVDPQGLRYILKAIDKESDRIAKKVRESYKQLGSSRRRLGGRLAEASKLGRIRFIAGEVGMSELPS